MQTKLSLSPDVFRPLDAWVHGTQFYMKSFEFYEQDVHVPENVFVGLDAVFEVHESPQAPLKTLEKSWLDTKNYVSAACQLLDRPRPGHALSESERQLVVAKFGEPPGPAWPLYLFAVGDAEDERVVYIGKTDARTHRFYAGHSAITALHRPEYRGLQTRLYLATLTIYSDEGHYMPLEWVHPQSLRNMIWSDAEAQLIYFFQPELNSALKTTDNSRMPTNLTLHNYTGTKNFDGLAIVPHREVGEDEWLQITS